MLNSNSVSKDNILMFGEIYLQKWDEYAGGEITGTGPDDNTYRGIMGFMIAGLKENVPFVVKDIPETELHRCMILWKEDTATITR